MTILGAAEYLIRLSVNRRGGALMRRVFGSIGSPRTMIRCKSTHGLTFALDPASIMDAEMVRAGYYEAGVLDAVLRHLPRNGVFWDVGANIGVHSLTVTHLRPDATVISFEPAPTPAARLLDNAALNGMKPRLLHIALGDAQGYAEMSLRIVGNSGVSSLKRRDPEDYDSAATVRVETGDAMISTQSAPPPNVLKIDVEGYESAVLQGLAKQLQSPSLSTIIFEADAEHLPATHAILEAAGFSIAEISGNNFLATR